MCEYSLFSDLSRLVSLSKFTLDFDSVYKIVDKTQAYMSNRNYLFQTESIYFMF